VFGNIHGPLHAVLLHVWGAVAGDAEWALRAPSALFGIAMVPAMAWLARRWLGEETAIPAAWLSAASPFLVWYSQEARNYAMLMLCVVLSGLALLGFRAGITPRGLAGYAVSTASGLLSNLSFVFVAPLHLKWGLGGRSGGGLRRPALYLVALGLALLTAPWLWEATRIWDWERLNPSRVVAGDESPLRGLTTFHVGALPFAAYTFSVGYSLGPSLRELRAGAPIAALAQHAPTVAVAAVVFGSLAFLGIRALKRRRRLGDAVAWLVLPALLVSYLALQNFKVFHPRYLAVAMPGYLLLLSAALADLRPRARALAALAIGALWGVSLWNHYFVPRYAKEDFRGAAAIVAPGASAGERVIAVNSHDTMGYYLRGAAVVEPFWLGYADEPERLEVKLEEALRGPGGSASLQAAWVVLSRPEDLDPRGVFARVMSRRHPDAQRHDLEGVTVWHVPPH
jgi:4-amino-4-deoxy-L-arabinose transferase-like glycosyltransferase